MIARIREDSGPPAEALCYVPGIDGTGELLLDTARELRRRFRLVTLCYASGPEPGAGEDPYAHLAASVVRALDGAGVERPLVLAESFGVALALRLALDHPERVRALALVNGFARYEPRWRIRLTARGARLLPRWLFDLGHRWVAPRALFGPRHRAALARSFRAATGGELDADYLRRFRMIAGVDLLGRLGELSLPVALFASDRDRVVRAVPAAQAIRRRVPHATLTVLEGAGHMVLPLPEEDWPERMAELARRGRAAGGR